MAAATPEFPGGLRDGWTLTIWKLSSYVWTQRRIMVVLMVDVWLSPSNCTVARRRNSEGLQIQVGKIVWALLQKTAEFASHLCCYFQMKWGEFLHGVSCLICKRQIAKLNSLYCCGDEFRLWKGVGSRHSTNVELASYFPEIQWILFQWNSKITERRLLDSMRLRGWRLRTQE